MPGSRSSGNGAEHRTLQSWVDFQQADSQPPLEEFFEKADNLAWDRVKDPSSQEQARIIAPLGDQEAFRSLLFEFTTNETTGLNRTYLVMHGLQYDWKFVRTFGRFLFWKREKTSLKRSVEPKVVHFAWGKGDLSVHVDISRRENGTEKVELKGQGISIVNSKDFAWQKGLEHVEIISFVVAAVVAVVTGLSTFYFNNPAFGSLQDYLSLFLWGAAVDQTKNALQILQSYSASPTKAP